MKRLTIAVIACVALLQGCSAIFPLWESNGNIVYNENALLKDTRPSRYIGIAPTSKYSPLPEVRNDVNEFAAFYVSEGYETQVICDVSFKPERVLAMLAWLTNSHRVVILYSGHGMVDEKGKDYAFFLGDLDCIWSYDDFHTQFLTPISEGCTYGNLVIDSCFSGQGVPRAIITNENSKLEQHTYKVLSMDLSVQPKYEVVAHPKNSRLKNFSIVSAVGKNDYADGQFRSHVRKGFDSFDSCDMSLFSFCMANQLALSSWMEYVAGRNWDYRKTKGTWKTVREIMNGTDNMQKGAIMHQASGRWIMLKPRTTAHKPQRWVGRDHDGNMW